MENKPNNKYNNYNFHICRYTKNSKQNNKIEEKAKEKPQSSKQEKKPKISANYNCINNKEIINFEQGEENKKNIITNNKIEEDLINKYKKENDELSRSIMKKGKLISELKDRCLEQKNMMQELINKIEKLKNFIPKEDYIKKRQKEREKFEEKLAIAAVDEQIINELYPDNSNSITMNKILNGDKKDANGDTIKTKLIKIKQIYYKENDYLNSECPICYDIFKDNELLKELKCKHIFHKECLSQWLLNMNSCPICNQEC